MEKLKICLVFIALHLMQCIKLGEAGKGTWQLLLNDTGVVAMQMVLTHRNTVVMLEQTGPHGYRLRHRANGTMCNHGGRSPSCYAHSVEYDISGNKIRPLNVQSDAWSSSGSIWSNGTILQTGGYGDGYRRVRYFQPCDDGNCDWIESRKQHLSSQRWYASNLLLPDGDRVIVVGGAEAFSYEFVPTFSSEKRSFDLPFLSRTDEVKDGARNNLYPFLHLSSDGHLFIFANRDSILFDYKRDRVVKAFPRIPGNGSRSYPSTGSSVILPLDHSNGFQKVEVMVCGGAALGAFKAATEVGKRFLTALSTCGRMVITGNNHKWKMESMPGPRLMHDMLLLPTGNVLIINGARHGCSGPNNAASPSPEPYLYRPRKTLRRRFSVLKSTKIARMYHSSAILLRDGRVLVAGSNPNPNNYSYAFKNITYPTELRLQAFMPDYLDRKFDLTRPHNVSLYTSNGMDGGVRYGEEFAVYFLLQRKPKNVVFSAYAPPFTTHSISMNQRMLRLRCKKMTTGEDGRVEALLEAPPSANVAPAGYYMLTVVNDGIPSLSQWVRFMHS